MRLLIILWLSAIFSNSIAQHKDEREQRIKETDVPAEILKELEPYIKNLKVKYIFETDGDDSSYEAKFRSKSRQFSVEFDTLGSLEDVEIEMKYTSLSKEVKKNIAKYLSKSSSGYKILRCQKQYVHIEGKTSETLRHAVNNESHSPINYELVVDLKMGSALASYELLFDASGNFIAKRVIVNRATDNLLY